MNRNSLLISTITLPARLLAMCLMSLCCFHGNALPADFYASSSRLSSGRWAKIEVSRSGMQFVSNTQLKNLGFADPDKVNVYGLGGRMLPESLDLSVPDDLPVVPSLRTATGILFFGHNNVSWQLSSSRNQTYTHTLNPYSDKSYYLLSDSEGARVEVKQSEVSEGDASGDAITVFTERVLHEQDLLAPSVSGRLMLGEDFRVQATRQFPFSLPGIAGDATVCVRFGAKVTNGQSSILVSANGNQLPATSSDKIAAVTSSETFIMMSSSIKTVENPGEKLNLAIQYSNTGALFTAALDYIQVEYPRALTRGQGELYFYLNPSRASSVKVEGCDANTVIWDVTDPQMPVKVNHSLSGSAATFTTSDGYREYVAFNPSEISSSVVPAGAVRNQDIHAMEAPDMVIISPEAYKSAAQRLADLHASTDGISCVVLSPEQIYNEFSSATPDVTAFRRMFKMWYDKAGGEEGKYPRYCLIFSRPTYDNKMVTASVKKAGYPRVPIWQSLSGLSASTSFSTDDYIGMLEDNPSSFSINTALIHVAVGRLPVKSLAEANSAVAKIEKYLLNPVHGSWRNNIMVIADDQDNGQHLNQAEDVINNMRRSANGEHFFYEKLYLDSYPLTMSPTGASYPLARQRMLDKIQEGLLYLNYIGHANPREWGHEKLLTWTDITSMTNANLPFIYAATCEFLRWDDDTVSGAEEMWLNPDSGIIGMICPSRKVYISLNGTLNANTSPYIFGVDSKGNPLSLGDAMVKGKNATTTDDGNRLRYAFMGDPSMKLPSPSFEVKVDNIGGTDLASSEDNPVVQARAKVKLAGSVTDADGNIVDDFNGSADIVLYDAEKVIDTYGNGTDGKVLSYNDRKTRLFIGKAEVKNGQWQADIIVPSEIENNFSPALISLYAYDSKGREANGSTERIHVFGYDTDVAEDYDGPSITGFYLNSPSFSDGASVSPSSVVYATFSDPSGINVSDTGIGHGMVITIDGKQRFDDVNLHYTPDYDVEKGSIAYPLNGIEPGEHSLQLTVWDNANNSSSATLKFTVEAGWLPTITELSTDVNPASSQVTFRVATDGMNSDSYCRIDVLDLSGRNVWSNNPVRLSGTSGYANISWNLHDNSGRRIPRGIYLYRATVITEKGAEVSKTRKLAVTAQ